MATRARPAVYACSAFSAILTLLVPLESVAGWGPEPITVRPTSFRITSVVACNDGSSGTFVAWQEEVSFGLATLRVQHVLATGDNDPAWPTDGAVACSVATARRLISATPDELGGVYVLWQESAQIYLSRLVAYGEIASGWPERGMLLATGGHLTAVGDGAHGIFVAWSGASDSPDGVPWIIRMGPDGAQAGWTGGPRMIRGPDPVKTIELWLTLAADSQGGAYLAWITFSTDSLSVPSASHIARVGPDGEPAPAWPAGGTDLAPFRWSEYTRLSTPHVDIAADGRGGVFVVTANSVTFTSPPWEWPGIEYRLYRLGEGATPAPGWPAEGRRVPTDGGEGWGQPDEAPDVLSDGLGGAFLGIPEYASEGYMDTEYTRWGDTGPMGWVGTAYPVGGKSIVPDDRGGLYLATFSPNGPFGYATPNALLSVRHRPVEGGWADLWEVHTEYGSQWYGDIALAPTGDGGGVFFWSQHNHRYGLFARRFSTHGEVTGISPAVPTAYGMRVHFVRGVGVRVRAVVPPDELARIDLLDVNGRRVSSLRCTGGAIGGIDLVLPRSGALASGVYFLKLAGPSGAVSGRIAVVQ